MLALSRHCVWSIGLVLAIVAIPAFGQSLAGFAHETQDQKQSCIQSALVTETAVTGAEAPGFATLTVKTEVTFFDGSCAVGPILVTYLLDGNFLGDSTDGANGFPISFALPEGDTYTFEILVLDEGTQLEFSTFSPPIPVFLDAPELVVTPFSEVDFGDVSVGQVADFNYTVQNVGSGLLSGLVSATLPFHVMGDAVLELPGGASRQVTIRFQPLFVAQFFGEVFFNGTTAGSQTVSVRGKGVGASHPLDVQVNDFDSGAPIIHAVVRVAMVVRQAGIPLPDSQLDWEVRSRVKNTFYHFDLPPTGEYKVVVNANGYETVNVINPITGNSTQTSFQVPANGGTSDSDGDGLADTDEPGLFGTRPNDVDSDDDGMSDLFEVEHELAPLTDPNDPSNPVDAGADPDGDGFTNLEESILRSNPHDPSDPDILRRFVSPSGNDLEGAGTRTEPWQTINGAIGNIYGFDKAEPGDAVAIVMLPGLYQEDVDLVENLTLLGEPTGEDLLQQAIIIGRIASAPGVTLKKFVLANLNLSKVDGPLFQADDANITVEDVDFLNDAFPAPLGIAFEGASAASALVTDCTFNSLATGIAVYGALPKIRRSAFQDMQQDGILIDDTGLPLGNNTLGSANDPSTGWNVFRDNGNRAVNNLRDEQIVMENNDWGTNDPNEVRALIAGPADFIPVAPAGIAPASLTCTVEARATRQRITSATVALAPANVPPLTDNIDGVYNFSAMVPDEYDITVEAEGFLSATLLNQDLSGGGTATLLFSLERVGAEGEGEGEGEDPAGCAPAPAAPRTTPWGELMVIAGAAGVLVAGRRYRRSG